MTRSDTTDVSPVTAERLQAGLDGIERYLLANAPTTTIAKRAAAAAKPIFDAMAARYPVARAEDLDQEKARELLSAFAQNRYFPQAFKVRTVSLAEEWEPLYSSLQPWVDQGAHIGGGAELHEFLYQSLFSFFWTDKGSEEWVEWIHRWDTCFESNLPYSQWLAQVLTPEQRGSQSVEVTLGRNLESALYNLFLFALAGDEVRFAKMELLAQVLAKTVPLGHDSSDCWLLPVK